MRSTDTHAEPVRPIPWPLPLPLSWVMDHSQQRALEDQLALEYVQAERLRATLMAGGDRGTWFIPEVNDEVLVAFTATSLLVGSIVFRRIEPRMAEEL